MQIGILGGTFDPPHVGHSIAASQVREYMKFDEVWLMPVASHAFGKNLSPADKRLEMLRLIETPHIRVSDFEIRLGGVSSTYHTMKALREAYPTHSFSFCMGSDLIRDFPLWNDWQALLRENPFVIFPRGESASDMRGEAARILGAEHASQIAFVEGEDVVVTNISSTIVRRRIEEGLDVSYLISSPILAYVRSHHLYCSHEKT